MTMPTKPREVVQAWLEALNRADAETLVSLYAKDAIYHQATNVTVVGREAIRAMFARSFAGSGASCTSENLLEDGEWVILEWRDPQGHRGCNVFHIPYGRILLQRDYGDTLSARSED
jgi:limonene-1,2-epoxide hydrolase